MTSPQTLQSRCTAMDGTLGVVGRQKEEVRTDVNSASSRVTSGRSGARGQFSRVRKRRSHSGLRELLLGTLVLGRYRAFCGAAEVPVPLEEARD